MVFDLQCMESVENVSFCFHNLTNKLGHSHHVSQTLNFKLCLQWSCNDNNDSSFLAIYCLLGCNHCTRFDKHEQNLHS